MTRTEPSTAGALRELRRWHLGSGGGAWMVDAAPPRMVREYNEMIDQYNRIRWVQ